MSMKGGRPRAASKGSKVGPDYPKERFEIPWDAGISGPVNSEFGEHRAHKTVNSVNETTFAPDLPHNETYDSLWEGK